MKLDNTNPVAVAAFIPFLVKSYIWIGCPPAAKGVTPLKKCSPAPIKIASLVEVFLSNDLDNINNGTGYKTKNNKAAKTAYISQT